LANPKNRHSKARTRSRRATWKIEAPILGECPQCHELKPSHIVCPNCGYYRGRQMATASAESK
jgi:large subunit ribosomal protein L32